MNPAPIVIVAMLMSGCHKASSDAPNQSAALSAPAAQASVQTTAPIDAGEPARSSHFTKVSEADCPLVDQDQETGDFSRRCAGVAGWNLLWTSGDLRDDLVVRRGKVATALGLPSLVANGAFDALGETVEWRGPAGGEPA